MQYPHHSPPTMAPSWAEVVGKGGVQPPVGSTNSSPPDRHCSSHPFATLLNLYRGCVQERRWALLTLETCDGEEQFNFCCSSKQATAAATAPSSAAATSRRRRRKRPPNEKRRQKERKRRHVWKETKRAALHSAAAAQATVAHAAAATAAASPAAAAPAAAAPAAAVPATTAAAATADVVMGTTVRVKAVATTAAALREQSKLWAGVRRSSARASVLDQRRNSVVSDTQESPEKIREADNMNNSFRIEFEDGDLQQQEMTCSSCLSIHCDMEQPLCLFCGWKVLE